MAAEHSERSTLAVPHATDNPEPLARDRSLLVAERRLLQGAAALLPVEDAAELRGGRKADAVRQLEAAGLVHTIPGTTRRVVIWGDVLDWIRSGKPAAEPAKPSPDALPRYGLRRGPRGGVR